MYNPNPIDTSDIKLSPEIEELMEKIAENVHEVWSEGRLSDGWKHEKERNDNNKTHPNLISYDELSEEDKDYDRNTARETLKVILKLGFKIKKPTFRIRCKKALRSVKESITWLMQQIAKRLPQCVVRFFRVRTIDHALSSGIVKQLCLLMLSTAIVWVVFFLAAKSIGYEANDLFYQPEQVAETTPEVEEKSNQTFPLWWTIYYHFIDPGSQHMATERSRPFTMLVSFFGSIMLTGIFISTISNIIERRIDRQKKGLLRYCFGNHIILFGYNDMTPYLIKQLRSDVKHKKRTIVVQTSRAVEEIRMQLYSELTTEERAHVILVYARRDKKDELKSLNVEKAYEVYILGESYLENRAEYAHDSLNMDCLSLIGQICKEEGRGAKLESGKIQSKELKNTSLKCNVLLEYQTTFSAFQFSDLSAELKKVIEFYPFNFYENWAQKVFVSGETSDKFVKYQPLDREQIGVNSEKRVHLVVVGMSKMGIAMAVEAAHIAHFPNFRSLKRKTKITFIDAVADEEMGYMKTRYKNLFDLTYSKYTDINNDSANQEFKPTTDYIDIEWEFIKGNVADAKIQDKINEWVDAKNDLLTIAICFNFPHTSISCALYLPERVHTENIPVLVLQRDSSAVINNIAGLSLSNKERAYLRYKNLRPFGMESDCFNLHQSDLLFAKRVRYVYEYYKRNKKTIPTVIPDINILNATWDKEEVVKMWSNRYNVDFFSTKLRSIGYTKKQWEKITKLTDAEVGILAEVEHNRWNVEKLLVGFRAPTVVEDEIITANVKEEKDKHKKRYIHYDIRPYDDLRVDGDGNNAKEYDVCLSKALPLIIKD